MDDRNTLNHVTCIRVLSICHCHTKKNKLTLNAYMYMAIYEMSQLRFEEFKMAGG